MQSEQVANLLCFDVEISQWSLFDCDFWTLLNAKNAIIAKNALVEK